MTGDIEKLLMENEIDVGVTFLPVEQDEIASIPLFTEELSLAVPTSHPFSREKMIELENTSLMTFPKNYFLRQLIDTHLQEIGITSEPTLEMTTLETLTEMVAEGIGVSILPSPYLDTIKKNSIAKVKLIHPTPKRTIGFVYRKDRFMCTATRAFIEQVKQTSKITSDSFLAQSSL